MKGFVKDYIDLCKHSCCFYKKHWKGVIVMNVVVYASTMAYYCKDQIKDAFKEKFSKEEEA